MHKIHGSPALKPNVEQILPTAISHRVPVTEHNSHKRTIYSRKFSAHFDTKKITKTANMKVNAAALIEFVINRQPSPMKSVTQTEWIKRRNITG